MQMQMQHVNVRLTLPFFLNSDNCSLEQMQHDNVRLTLPFCLNDDKSSVMHMAHDKTLTVTSAA